VGDAIIAGESVGKVRALLNDAGDRVKSAGPAVPVQILGLNAVPAPGDEFRVAKSLDAAKKIASHRVELRKELEHSNQGKVSLEDLFSKLNAGDQKELKIIIKADVQGSVEALRTSLEALSTKKVTVRVISGGVGAIVESDVEFASASEALVVGFGVRPDTKAIKASRALGGIELNTYNVIYECVDEVKLAMQGLLSPIRREKYLGRAEVRQTFSVPKLGTIAGCAIIDGIVSRSSQIRVLRDSKEIYSGRLSSLKCFKDDVREVKEGFECGMGVEKFNDLREGDVIESFEMEEIAAVLDEPVVSGDEARI
jgi:translation initiation factor IF-2